MKKAFYIGFVIFLVGKVPAVSQDLRAFDPVNLTGYWQTDSAAQLGAKINRLSQKDTMADRTVSADIDRAVISREYGFFDNGIFTAQWLLGSKLTVVNGTWGMVARDRIFIEVDGTKSEYLVNHHGKDGIVLVPQRERRGEVHELYFIKQEEK